MVSNLLPPPTQLLVEPRSGAVDEAWYRFFDTISSTIDDLSASSGDALTALTALFPLTSTKLYRATNTTFIPQSDNAGPPNLKYSEWWITSSSVKRVTKPTHDYFQGAWITVVGGGGGSGTSSNDVSPPDGNIGGGGAGGAWARKWLAEADWPDELIVVAGKGGQAGGIDSSGNTTGASGGLSATEIDGGDADISAVLTDTNFEALAGANDAAKLVTLLARTEAQLTSDCIFWCDSGKGGLDGGTGSFTNQKGVKGGNLLDGGVHAFGDYDESFFGANGGGEGDGIADISPYSAGGLGAGGAAGCIFDNIWQMVSEGSNGLVGRLAGAGGPSPYAFLGSGTAHVGRHGRLFGGGACGGTKLPGAAHAETVVGGFGAPGAVEIQFYVDTTDSHDEGG